MAIGFAAVAIASTPLSAQAAQVSDFKDVRPTAWYYDAVDYATRAGLFSGTSATTFSPEQSMTRGMFVTVLGNQAGVDKSRYNTSRFADVSPTAWYGPYVAWAADAGIVSGIGGGQFAPNQPITREQLAAMLLRYVQAVGGDTSLSVYDLDRFPDSGKISGYAREAMSWAMSHGIIAGSDGKLLPQGTATRAQAAQIFMRAQEILAGAEVSKESGQQKEEAKNDLPNLTLYTTDWTEDQNPYEIVRQIVAGTGAKWDAALDKTSASREVLIDFADWGDTHYTGDWAVYNDLELLNDTGADRFYICEEIADGTPQEGLTLYFTVPERADSPVLARAKALVQEKYPNARFEILGGGHGWSGYTASYPDLTLEQNARRVADAALRNLSEWHRSDEGFTYWISEPTPGRFYYYY